MPNDVPANVTIEDARLIFLNFAGREGRFNSQGERNFCVVLDNKTAQQMKKDGWNVKLPKDITDPDMEQQRDPFLPVAVKFTIKPPTVVMITSAGRRYLTEHTVEILDSMEFANVDLVVNASRWDVNEKTGIKAYLKSIYVTIEEDDLARKYANIPESE